MSYFDCFTALSDKGFNVEDAIVYVTSKQYKPWKVEGDKVYGSHAGKSDQHRKGGKSRGQMLTFGKPEEDIFDEPQIDIDVVPEEEDIVIDVVEEPKAKPAAKQEQKPPAPEKKPEQKAEPKKEPKKEEIHIEVDVAEPVKPAQKAEPKPEPVVVKPVEVVKAVEQKPVVAEPVAQPVAQPVMQPVQYPQMGGYPQGQVVWVQGPQGPMPMMMVPQMFPQNMQQVPQMGYGQPMGMPMQPMQPMQPMGMPMGMPYGYVPYGFKGVPQPQQK